MKKSYLPLLLCWACLGHLMMAMEPIISDTKIENGTTYTIHINQDVPDNNDDEQEPDKSSKNIIYVSQEKTEEFLENIKSGFTFYEVEMMLILTATKKLREELSEKGNNSIFIQSDEFINSPSGENEFQFSYEKFSHKKKYKVMVCESISLENSNDDDNKDKNLLELDNYENLLIENDFNNLGNRLRDRCFRHLNKEISGLYDEIGHLRSSLKQDKDKDKDKDKDEQASKWYQQLSAEHVGFLLVGILLMTVLEYFFAPIASLKGDEMEDILRTNHQEEDYEDDEYNR